MPRSRTSSRLSAALIALVVSPAALAVEPPQLPGDLIVTEVMTEPQLVPNYYGQWFEIYNASGTLLDLNGVVIRDREGDEISIAGETLMAPRTYLVLGVDTDTSRNGNIPVDIAYAFNNFRVDKTGDEIVITYNNQLIDELVWTSAWGLSPTAAFQVGTQGYLEWANDLRNNWCDSEAYIDGGLNGTPGTANHYCLLAGQDNDGDGYSEQQGDCDDSDPTIGPSVIDGDRDPFGEADDDADCDGVRDDGTTDDGDGYAEVDGDCNDNNQNVNPARREGTVADGVDNDCNCYVDDIDADSDGYPNVVGAVYDPGIFYLVQDPSDGFCLEAEVGDCDDSISSVNPDAEEVPYDGIDQDCDGFDVCDVDGDNYDAVECGGNDCNDDDDGVYPGAPDALAEPDGVDNNCDGVIDSPDRDGDGYGANGALPDCDDEDPDVHPGIEIDDCTDFKDNDCDGWYNEDCEVPALSGGVRGGSLFCGTTTGGSGAPGLALAGLMLAFAASRRRSR